MADWTPTLIDGCKLWVAADEITGLADGAAVSQWADLSGLGNHATQATGTAQPSYQTSEINSLPVVRFDGAGDYLQLPDLMSGMSAGTVLIVFRLALDPPTNQFRTGHPLGDWGTNAGVDGGSHLPYLDGVIYDCWGTSARKTTVNPTPSMAVPSLYGVLSAANDWRSWLNGTQLFSTATNTVLFRADPKIGRALGTSGTAQYYFDGDVAEIVAYGSALSTGDRQSVEGYLAHKWGIAASLPAGHPYKAAPPTAPSTGPVLSSPHALNYLDPSAVLSSPHLIGSLR